MNRNKIIELSGNFSSAKNIFGNNEINIPANSSINSNKIEKLKNELENVLKYWKTVSLEINPLITCTFDRVMAKSKRIKGLFYSGFTKNNAAIVGAKFISEKLNDESYNKKHVITYCIELSTLQESLSNLKKVIDIIKETFKSSLSHETINAINEDRYKEVFSSPDAISKKRFLNIVVDCFYLENISVQKEVSTDLKDNMIVTIYKTNIETKKILEKLGIDSFNKITDDGTTLLLHHNDYENLKSKAPFLISMEANDLFEFETEDFMSKISNQRTIDDPKNEPIIGVIDTMFDKNVYFSKWVEFKNMLNEEISLSQEDYAHGTAVSSIIVDGHRLNPELDDGCGHFRVRHFGVASSRYFSAFAIANSIEEIVRKNSDIKVWNLSLGSNSEINENSISYVASRLDKIQFENDVIFVVAGTNNKNENKKNLKKIGSPADSINSLVVNSVDFKNNPANYTRIGEVLSFFIKPDVSYYGGTEEKGIKVFKPMGETFSFGTSFAAPWIARKLAFIIHKMQINRELAKALIIDSAIKWNSKKTILNQQKIGHGVVPIKINDILTSASDEIRILLTSKTKEYETYNHNIPVPVVNENKHPFIARATLCYFPNCNRNQGVDYTNSELDIHFGRIKLKDNKLKIDSINKNKQSEDQTYLLYEKEARELFRKWDNVKHIYENFLTKKGGKRRLKKQGIDGKWGISIKVKERLNNYQGRGLKFGIVITLKEINGNNMLQKFINLCEGTRAWNINKVDIEKRLDIYEKIQEEIFNK